MRGIASNFAYHGAAPAVDRNELERVNTRAVARGPDGCGFWFGKSGRIGMAHRRLAIGDLNARILFLGINFKDNCADLRNSLVIEVLRSLQAMHAEVAVHYPWADLNQLDGDIRALMLAQIPEQADFDGVLIAVAHQQFRVLGAQALRGLLKANGRLFDAKCVLSFDEAGQRL